jgi:hypothetical protein
MVYPFVPLALLGEYARCPRNGVRLCSALVPGFRGPHGYLQKIHRIVGGTSSIWGQTTRGGKEMSFLDELRYNAYRNHVGNKVIEKSRVGDRP